MPLLSAHLASVVILMAFAEPVLKRAKLAPGPLVPLVDLEEDEDADGRVVAGLQGSGFLLLRSAELPGDLQRRALTACRELLGDDSLASTHPSDPKRYAMLRRSDLACHDSDAGHARRTLSEYWAAVDAVKSRVLRALARGLELDADFFAARHSQQNNSLRLLHYPPCPDSGNRCKEHSDYGTITLLSTDGTPGLEIWDDAESKWTPIPEVAAGTMILNAGSLLSGWTRGAIRATLHRVAGPASLHSGSSAEQLRRAAAEDRYSLAFFVDPDPELRLTDVEGGDAPGGVADYVRWRCGAAGEGVSFAPGEEARTLGSAGEPSAARTGAWALSGRASHGADPAAAFSAEA
mmetsp:Transcript_12813/g.40416  ORF Transcript_12813/g.40416 Transcript_12813/m.40416 type:complete len:349 (-) Transcript_12813:118-1164(-)